MTSNPLQLITGFFRQWKNHFPEKLFGLIFWFQKD
jgi:hypothetical protein